MDAHSTATIGNALLVQGRDRRGKRGDFIVSRPGNAKLNPFSCGAAVGQQVQRQRTGGCLHAARELGEHIDDPFVGAIVDAQLCGLRAGKSIAKRAMFVAEAPRKR